MARDLRAHPRAVGLFVVFWVAIWVVTVLTWQYDAAGYSVGMSTVAVPLQFVLPLIVGIGVGRWRADTPKATGKDAGFAGLAFALIQFPLVPLVLAPVWWPMPEPRSDITVWDWAAEAIGFVVLYAAICVALSIVGAWVGSRRATT